MEASFLFLRTGYDTTVSEEGSIQGLRGEKGYPPDGDGTPPGCGGGAEHSSVDRSAQD
jgi:hypothetical protein